jgi:hypothetical protein
MTGCLCVPSLGLMKRSKTSSMGALMIKFSIEASEDEIGKIHY